jgi:hypothetical protein
MIQITPQMRVLVAIEPVDGRKYAPSIDMRSLFKAGLRDPRSASSKTVVPACRTPHNVAFQAAVRTGSRERTTWRFLNFCHNPIT